MPAKPASRKRLLQAVRASPPLAICNAQQGGTRDFNAKPPPCAVHDGARRVLFELIGSLDPAVRAAVAGVAFDGTSATALLVDPRVDPLAVGKVVSRVIDRWLVNCSWWRRVGAITECKMPEERHGKPRVTWACGDVILTHYCP